MEIQLSDHFTYEKLARFTIPSIAMMIFTSIYGVVDGMFVSNFVGKTAFAAVNLIIPYLMIFGTLGFMIGTGGSALISKTMGEGKAQKAREQFSLLVYVSAAAGAVLAVAGMLAIRNVAALLGAEGQMLEDCVLYGRITLVTLPCFIVQNEFQTFCVTAEKPRFGLWVTVAAGVTNIVLDAVLVGLLPGGIAGAAAATALSQTVGAVIPLVYFARPNPSPLRLVKTPFDGATVLKSCTNGSSELVSNLSMSLVSMLYNFQLMRFAGEDGIAAYGVIMYINFLFVGVFLGYSFGVAPVVGYHYGAENHGELHSLLKKSLLIIGGCAVVFTVAAEGLAGVLSAVFVGYDEALWEMTKRGFMIYTLSFLFMGFNMFASSFFTALNNGFLSALISFLRAFLFQIGAILVLPLFWELDGIWFSVVAAELLALFVSTACMALNQKKYGY